MHEQVKEQEVKQADSEMLAEGNTQTDQAEALVADGKNTASVTTAAAGEE